MSILVFLMNILKNIKYMIFKKHITFFSLTLISLLVIYLRNSGKYPITFADEWLYSHYSIFNDPGSAPRPNYFYLYIFSIIRFFDFDFYNIARLFNLFFFTTGCYFIFLLARNIMSEKYALAVYFLSLLSSSNAYTIFFMPEATYFCFFWIFFYTLFNFERFNNNLIILSISFSLLFFIKPHAVFLLPIILISFFLDLYKNNYSKSRLLKMSFVNFFKFIIITLFIVNLLCLLFKGEFFISFGGSEGDYEDSFLMLFNLDKITKILYSSIYYFFHHLYSFFIFIFPLTLLLINNFRQIIQHNEKKLIYLILLSITSIILYISIFQAQIYLFVEGPYEIHGRLSQRHYDFLFPGIYIIIFLLFKYTSSLNISKFFIIFAILISLILFYFNFNFSHILITDAPYYYSSSENYILMLSLLVILFILFFIFHNQFSYKKYLIIFFVFLSSFISQERLIDGFEINSKPNIYDKTALYVNTFLDKNEKIAFYGNDLASMYRLMFYFQNNSYAIHSECNSEIIIPNDDNIKYVITFCDYQINQDLITIEENDEFRLYELAK